MPRMLLRAQGFRIRSWRHQLPSRAELFAPGAALLLMHKIGDRTSQFVRMIYDATTDISVHQVPEALRTMGTSDADPALLTPDEVRNAQFLTVRFFEGYAMDEVDDFLDVVASDLELRWKARTLPTGSADRAAVSKHRLDAAAVRHQTFHTVRVKEGYSMYAVDEFLERIEHTFRIMDQDETRR